ncbi:MAG: MBOAT family protein [Lachnospiraceae bacterium]|nr:MBOAT family protein [Lachnospiraceae bacterium]
MLFNSLAFAVFLPIVFLLYWAIPQKYRWIVLFISSYYFYMSWNVKYVVLILFTTAISYAAALGMEKLHKQSTKRLLVIGAVGASLLVLFFFKYFDFTQNTVVRLMQMFAVEVHPVTLALMLPVGISFYTFQTLSYAIDVYRGEVKAERNFFKYATFVSFFPQLVAGPIERTGNLLPQIDCEHKFTYEKGAYGMRLMAWGFFKKLVIADNLAVFVDAVFEDVASYHGFALVLAVVFFTLQIYCDFSGYSDIAIGVAKLFDINLMTNFKSPYFSASIKEFWRRWHISLSGWFRDYVYIPLGGNRVSKKRNMFNLLATFTLSGLWHGAAFTYIVWGGLHGVLQCAENVLYKKKVTEHKETEKKLQLFGRELIWWGKVAVVFCFVAAAWCFFRAGSCREACYIFAHMADGLGQPLLYIDVGVHSFDTRAIKDMIIPVLLLMVYDYIALDKDPIQLIGQLPTYMRKMIYFVFLFLLLMLASFNSQEFVYFQF